MDYGFWSVVPPLLTIVLAITTKEVLMSLFIGVFCGALIVSSWNPLGAITEMMNMLVGGYTDDEEYVIGGALTDPWNVEVLIICILLGGLIGLMVRSGGSRAFGEMLQTKIKSKKGAQLLTWVIGIIIFFDDYFNALTNGSISRPISDRFGISREKLSYIIDSTAVGICLIVPLSSWVAFMCSLIGGAFADAGMEVNSFRAFLSVIPHNYYAWLSILMVLAVILLGLDFGPMAKAEKRAKLTGELCEQTFSGGDADEDDYSSIPVANGKPIDLLLPILLLIALALTLMLWTGGLFSGATLLEAVDGMDGMLALCLAVGITVIFAIIFYAFRRLSKITESLNAFVTGTKSMLYVLILLAFAWSIGTICDTMGTAPYINSVIEAAHVPGAVIPLILFVFACCMTFATGASWGTFAIMIPLAVPMALAADQNVYACLACVIGGGGFGNHCSPLADTCILASCSSNIRHTDHVKTQIPYSVTCAASAAVGYIVEGILTQAGIHSWIIPLVVTFGVFFVLLIVLSKLFGGNKASDTELLAEAEKRKAEAEVVKAEE